jgi:hypothetical protein
MPLVSAALRSLSALQPRTGAAAAASILLVLEISALAELAAAGHIPALVAKALCLFLRF